MEEKSITLDCPLCEHEWNVNATKEGQSITCPSCNREFKMGKNDWLVRKIIFHIQIPIRFKKELKDLDLDETCSRKVEMSASDIWKEYTDVDFVIDWIEDEKKGVNERGNGYNII